MSSDNKVDKDGLTYFWNKATAYIQETVEYAQQLWVKIGNIQMGTTAATITGAIKELVDKIGNTAMGTTATTVTGAVKEHNDLIGDETMGTTATTLTGAIAEHETDIANLNSKIYGTISSSHTLTDNASFVIKCGPFVFLTMGITLKSNVSAYGTIATLPTGYRPLKQVYGVSSSLGGYDITMGGNIRVTTAKNSGEAGSITIMYIAG